jgi:hypothetical protein
MDDLPDEAPIRRGPEPLNVVMIMEEVLERLKVLDYEAGFCRKRFSFVFDRNYISML